MENKEQAVVTTMTEQQQEYQILKLKREAEFDLTPIGQQVKQFEATMRIAKMYATSSFIPDSYKYKGQQPLSAESVIANCTIALEMATRMQANPLMVMQNLYIVHGQPSFSSKFLIACINASKRFSPLRYEFRGEEGTDEYGCRAVAYEVTDTKHKDPLCGDWITIKMAKAEGWTSKKGSKWLTMPSQMLRYRAAAFWQRAYCPEISMGLMTAEEVNDTYAEYEEVQPKRIATQIPTDELGRPSLTTIAAQAQAKSEAIEVPQSPAEDIPEAKEEQAKSFSKEVWQELKNESNCAIFVNFGAYYKMYDEDAEKASSIITALKVVEDTENVGFKKSITFPKSYIKNVIPELIRNGVNLKEYNVVNA